MNYEDETQKLLIELIRTSIQEQVDYIEHLKKELERSRKALKQLTKEEKG